MYQPENFYKSGPRKGQEKTIKEVRDGGVRHNLQGLGNSAKLLQDAS